MEAGGAETPTVNYEQDLPEPGRRSLAETGLPVRALPARDDGAGHAHLIRDRTGRLHVATDPRADGAALTDES
jgi:hypothetical protein